MKRTYILLLFSLVVGCAPPQAEPVRPVGPTSSPNPGQGIEASVARPAYDETADARADIASAIKIGQTADLPVLVVFGADWCGDCRKLDAALRSGRTATLVNSSFKTVKVNVGKFDKNTDLAQQYGVPLRKGIPTIAILSTKGDVLYATKAGELANARSMGDEGLFAFFSQLAAKTKQ
jgi:protein disulfide-isomerase